LTKAMMSQKSALTDDSLDDGLMSGTFRWWHIKTSTRERASERTSESESERESETDREIQRQRHTTQTTSTLGNHQRKAPWLGNHQRKAPLMSTFACITSGSFRW
jgi:Flp pilus assembly protein TadB